VEPANALIFQAEAKNLNHHSQEQVMPTTLHPTQATSEVYTTLNQVIAEETPGNQTINDTSIGTTVYGGAGHNEINLIGGDDTAYSGFGTDGSLTTIYNVGGGNDSIFTSGHTVDDFGTGHDSIYGNYNGGDNIYVSGGNDVVFLQNTHGTETVAAGAGTNVVYGGHGTNNFTAEGGTATFYGGDGTNHLTGGTGSSTLVGGTGTNTMSSGTGSTQMTGGTGTNDFVVAHDTGHVVVTNFNAAHGDNLDFTALGVSTSEILDNQTNLAAHNGVEIQLSGVTVDLWGESSHQLYLDVMSGHIHV
jgi:Ca2+-binding RTX toxin-like protein